MVFILQKYGCNMGLILLEHSTFKGIAFTIAMRSRKFKKYLYLHLQKGSLVSRACCISDITRQQNKSPSPDIKRFIMEITKSKKMHQFRKSKLLPLSFNQLFKIVEPVYSLDIVKSFRRCIQSHVRNVWNDNFYGRS